MARELPQGNEIRPRWFLEIAEKSERADRPLTRFVLRGLDVLLAATALALLSPFLLLLALIIKLDSPGPVIFRQVRVGLGHRHFRMFKLRTMVQDSSPHGLSLTSENDPRVTRVGQFMRHYHIDEIPQFWNVIIGDMSIVGPRPEVPELVDINSAGIPGYDERLALRPGITGLAQITNGYSASLDELRTTVELDRHYIRHHCVLNYLKVLLRTIPAVLTGAGAV